MVKGIRKLRSAETDATMARALDFAGHRWALRMVWELRGGPLNFRGLQNACGHISPSVLQQRIHEARELGLIETISRLGYRLSAAGEGLFHVLVRLNAWSDTQAENWNFGDKLD